jgi:hypothetical protein
MFLAAVENKAALGFGGETAFAPYRIADGRSINAAMIKADFLSNFN